MVKYRAGKVEARLDLVRPRRADSLHRTAGSESMRIRAPGARGFRAVRRGRVLRPE
jgi:hypothetical protein